MHAKATMAGKRMLYGTVSSFTQIRINGRLSMIRITFPIQNETMRPQNRAGSSLITLGPGMMPWMMKAPSMSAMTGCAGRPSVSSGMKEV